MTVPMKGTPMTESLVSLVNIANGEVKLETDDGGHVGWAVILPFNIPPHVIIWGERVFRYGGFLEGATASRRRPYLLYKEAFTFALVTPVTQKRPE